MLYMFIYGRMGSREYDNFSEKAHKNIGIAFGVKAITFKK